MSGKSVPPCLKNLRNRRHTNTHIHTHSSTVDHHQVRQRQQQPPQQQLVTEAAANSQSTALKCTKLALGLQKGQTQKTTDRKLKIVTKEQLGQLSLPFVTETLWLSLIPSLSALIKAHQWWWWWQCAHTGEHCAAVAQQHSQTPK